MKTPFGREDISELNLFPFYYPFLFTMFNVLAHYKGPFGE